MFESAGGDIFAWLRNLGGTSGTGAMAAPGMTEAGYTLAPGLTQSTSDPAQAGGNWFGTGATNKDVASALGGLGKSAGGAAGGKEAGPIMPGSGGGGAGVGRPTAQSLAPLLQLLNQRRDALLQSATGGVGAGQAQGVRPTAGLLGF